MTISKIKTAVILCGGKGTRLGQLGKKIPKCLVKIHKKPIIWYIIKTLKKNSFNHLILPIGYRGKMVKKYLNQKDFQDLKIQIIPTGENTNIAKRIFLIKERIISKDFLLLNGDAIFDLNVKKIYETHTKNKIDMTLIGCESQLAFGTIGVQRKKVISFDREITYNAVKVKNKKNFVGYVYSGMSILNKKLLSSNFKDYKNFEKSLYPKIIKKYNCEISTPNGYWHSIDNVKDIQVLNKKNNSNKFIGIKKIIKNLSK